LDSGASHLQGDANRLQQIVWNLLSNAIKFSADGGKVTVVTERLGSTVSIQVIDTGSGIAAEFLPFVFDRFRQADGSSTRQHGGLGLGLAIVRHLVELHGGTIYANSAGLGQGATFTVELPIGGAAGEGTPLDGNDESNQANPSAAPAVGANLPLSGANILIVDDEPDCRELVATIVRMRGALSHTAASVAEAVHLLGQNRYSALICDLAMPFEDGYSFIDWLRKSETGTGFRLPAIVLTANAGVQDRTRALAAGFDEFVAKPVQPNDLVKIIVELLGAASNFPSLAECTE
jgi:CheY-like chemotaxis protein